MASVLSMQPYGILWPEIQRSRSMPRMGSTLQKHMHALSAGQLSARDSRGGGGTKTATCGGHFLFQYWWWFVFVRLLLSWLLFGRLFLGRLLLHWLRSGCVLRFGRLRHNLLLLVPARNAVRKLDFVRPVTLVIHDDLANQALGGFRIKDFNQDLNAVTRRESSLRKRLVGLWGQ